jgi:hypothetical protein
VPVQLEVLVETPVPQAPAPGIEVVEVVEEQPAPLSTPVVNAVEPPVAPIALVAPVAPVVLRKSLTIIVILFFTYRLWTVPQVASPPI